MIKYTFITAAIVLLIGCSGSATMRTDSVNAENDASLVAKQFFSFLHAGEADKAFGLFAVNDKMPKEYLDDEKGDLKRLSNMMVSGDWHFSIIETHTDGDIGVACVNTDLKRGQPAFDIDPLYLIKVNEKWSIVPGMNKIRPAALLVSENDYSKFEILEQWFDKRSEELENEHK